METKLRRDLGLMDVFSLTSGAMISSGLFILPGIAFSHAGPAVFLSYLIAGFIALPAALSASEMVSAFPKTGGVYYYVSRGMGGASGAVAGFSRWLAITINSSFALVGAGLYTAMIFDVPPMLVALLFGIFFIIVNMIGMKWGSRTEIIMVLWMLAALALYVIMGFFSVKRGLLTPLVPFGPIPVLQMAGFVFISYGGLISTTSIAEEIKRPERTIPMGIFLSLMAVTALYTLAVLVTAGTVEPSILSKTVSPITDGAFVSMGIYGVAMMAVAAFLAFVTTANSGVISASRYPVAMSRDHLLPGWLSVVNRRFRTPVPAIIVTGMIMTGVMFFLNVEMLASIASALLMITFALTNLAVIFMRVRKVPGYNPKFRCPLFPLVQILGIILIGILISGLGLLTVGFSLMIILGALLWYLVSRRAGFGI